MITISNNKIVAFGTMKCMNNNNCTYISVNCPIMYSTYNLLVNIIFKFSIDRQILIYCSCSAMVLCIQTFLSRLGMALYSTSLISITNTHSKAHEMHVCKLEKTQGSCALLITWMILWLICHTQALTNFSSKAMSCTLDNSPFTQISAPFFPGFFLLPTPLPINKHCQCYLAVHLVTLFYGVNLNSDI